MKNKTTQKYIPRRRCFETAGGGIFPSSFLQSSYNGQKISLNFKEVRELALGLPLTRYPDYMDGVRLRYMHTDLLWLLRSPNRFRTKPGWFDFRRTTDQIFSLRDPWPWVTYTVQGLKKYRKEKAKRGL